MLSDSWGRAAEGGGGGGPRGIRSCRSPPPPQWRKPRCRAGGRRAPRRRARRPPASPSPRTRTPGWGPAPRPPPSHLHGPRVRACHFHHRWHQSIDPGSRVWGSGPWEPARMRPPWCRRVVHMDFLVAPSGCLAVLHDTAEPPPFHPARHCRDAAGAVAGAAVRMVCASALKGGGGGGDWGRAGVRAGGNALLSEVPRP